MVDVGAGLPMKCDRCGHDGDMVLATRRKRPGTVIHRRRKCKNCGHVFPTVEQSATMLREIASAVQDGVDAMTGKNGDGK